MRAYLRLDPLLPEHKADAGKGEDYPDGALSAFVLTLCWGARQSPRGTFSNRAVLGALLRRRARWIPYLIEHGDLIVGDDGSLAIEGWATWQEGRAPAQDASEDADREGPLSDAERARRYRERRRSERHGVTGGSRVTASAMHMRDVTQDRSDDDISRADRVTSPGSVTADGELRDLEAWPDLVLLAEQLTGRPYCLPNRYGGLGAAAYELLERHGLDVLGTCWRRLAVAVPGGKSPTVSQLVFGAQRSLDAPPTLGRTERTEVDEAATTDELRRRAAEGIRRREGGSNA